MLTLNDADDYDVSATDNHAPVALDDTLPVVMAYATAPVTAADQAPGTFTVALSQTSPAAVTLEYEVGGSAVPGVDYQSISDGAPYGYPMLHVVMQADQTQAQVNVQTLLGGSESTVTLEPLWATDIPGNPVYAPWPYNPAVTIVDDRPEWR